MGITNYYLRYVFVINRLYAVLMAEYTLEMCFEIHFLIWNIRCKNLKYMLVIKYEVKDSILIKKHRIKQIFANAISILDSTKLNLSMIYNGFKDHKIPLGEYKFFFAVWLLCVGGGG